MDLVPQSMPNLCNSNARTTPAYLFWAGSGLPNLCLELRSHKASWRTALSNCLHASKNNSQSKTWPRLGEVPGPRPRGYPFKVITLQIGRQTTRKSLLQEVFMSLSNFWSLPKKLAPLNQSIVLLPASAQLCLYGPLLAWSVAICVILTKIMNMGVALHISDGAQMIKCSFKQIPCMFKKWKHFGEKVRSLIF